MTATTAATLWSAGLDDVPVTVTTGGGLLAVAGAEGGCAVLDTGTGARHASFTVDDDLLHAAFSPDGAHLALTGTTGYRLWHARDQRPDPPHRAGWSARAVWAADGRVAVAAGRRVAVHAADGTQLWRTAAAPSTITDLTWYRQDREVAAAAYTGIHRYAPHRQEPVGRFTYPGSHLAIAATGSDRWICTGNQDRSVHIWRTRDGSELEMAGYPDKVTRLAFDGTGRWLANDGAPDVTVWDFSGKGPGGRSPRMLRAHDGVSDLAWRPGGGDTLASGGTEGTVALWRVSAGIPGRPMRPARRFDLGDPVTAVAWLDQRRLVVATRAGHIRVLDADPPAPGSGRSGSSPSAPRRPWSTRSSRPGTSSA